MTKPIDSMPEVTAEVSQRVRRLRFGFAVVGLALSFSAGAALAWVALEVQFAMMDRAYSLIVAGAAVLPTLLLGKVGPPVARRLIGLRMASWRREFLGRSTVTEDELEDVFAMFR